ncbi:MAG TPA: YCF48-related protein [Bacteroidales bacterium]
MKTLLFVLLILIAFNSTAQWAEIQSEGIGSIELNTIYFINEDTGYVEGRYRQNEEWINSYFKTMDGGANWTKTSIEGGEGNIYFVNDTLGFVGGFPVQKTIDGGINWTSYETAPFGDRIQFVDDSIGFILSVSNLFKTIDAGTSWTQLEVNPSTGLPHNMHFINENIGYLVGYSISQHKALILKTIDGGINWTQQIAGNLPLFDVYFTDINTGYAVGGGLVAIPHAYDYKSVIFKTIDGGVNWIQQYSKTPEELQSVVFTDAETGYAVGGLFGTILKTVNGGTNWIHQESQTFSYLKSVYFVNSEIGYIAGIDGVILKTTNGGDTLAVFEKGYNDKCRIYPNPASQKIIIDFENPNYSLFELAIFNNLGIKVLKLNSITGEIIEIDLNSFTQGIYYYNLKSSKKGIRYSGKFIKN